jgi:hypothetical protein
MPNKLSQQMAKNRSTSSKDQITRPTKDQKMDNLASLFFFFFFLNHNKAANKSVLLFKGFDTFALGVKE